VAGIPLPRAWEKHIPVFGSSKGTRSVYFGCSFSAAELMQ
jgi:hypothetical protein